MPTAGLASNQKDQVRRVCWEDVVVGAIGIKGLYYITHIENLPSIMRRGILSHEQVKDEAIRYTPTYDEGIVAARKEKLVPGGRRLYYPEERGLKHFQE